MKSEKASTQKNATFDPVAFSKNYMEVLEQGMPLLQNAWTKTLNDFASLHSADPFKFNEALSDFWLNLFNDPERFAKAQIDYLDKMNFIWQGNYHKFLGHETVNKDSEKQLKDKRFKDASWQENIAFNIIKQTYLVSCDWIMDLVEKTKGLTTEEKRRLEFAARQYTDALSPSNYFMTNPEILNATLETNGQNLIDGLKNLIDDLDSESGTFRISKTNYSAFKVGENLATTPGKVVYQNRLMQLIQYSPSTKSSFETPLLFIPPWINKYYILDMKPENSLIKWAVDQGHTVFVISWVNPDKTYAETNFEDYMQDGILEACKQIQVQTDTKQVNAVGYCIGGTLLATTLAYLAAKGEEELIKSATFFTTLIDFENAGDLSLFLNEEQLKVLEDKIDDMGYLDSASLQNTFNILRSGDLIWSFIVNNYMLGKDPFPFDLLYWNDDSTNMPAAMHKFYLRNMYRDNLLCQKGAMTLKGKKIDLSKIKTPCYFLSCKDDHIAPWASTYNGQKCFEGADVKFTLSASGHVAGVINPPSKNKYGFWQNNNTKSSSAEEWLENADYFTGSWWENWQDWLKPRTGKERPARSPDKGKLKPIEPAPGSYVLNKPAEKQEV